MNKENVAHLHIRVLLSGKKKNNDILNFAYKWVEIENTILSEISPKKMNMVGTHS